MASSWLSIAGAQDPVYRHFNVENGLPSSEVYQSFQDQNGYMWFATDLGLARFDGYSFQTFDIHSGLADNVNFIFFEDTQHRLWLSGHTRGLSYICDSGIVQYAFNAAVLQELNTTVIRSFHVDVDQTVRITAVGKGYILVIDSIGQITKEPLYSKPYDKRMYWVQEFPSGNTLLSMHSPRNLSKPLHDAIFLHIQENGTTRNYDVQLLPKDGNSVVSNTSSINYIRTGPDEFALLTNGMLTQFKGNARPTKRELPFAPTHSLTSDEEGNLWFGTFGKGLIKVPKDTTLPYQQFFQGTSVSQIKRDREGGYWITTLNDGVYYIPDWEIKSALPQSTANSWIKSLYKKENTMLAGENNGILYQWDLDASGAPQKSPRSTQLLSRILSIKGAHDRVIVTSNDGVGNYTLGDLTIENYIGRTALVAQNGQVWVAGGSNIHVFDARNELLNFINDLQLEINGLSMVEVGEAIWIAHRRGLYEYKEGQIINHSQIQPLLDIRINDLKAYRDGIVLATLNGVYYYANGKVSVLASRNDLEFNTCRTLEVEDDSTIWVGTNTGLGKLEIQDPLKPSGVIKNQLFYRDGFSSGNIYDLELTQRYIWIATTAGINFLPKEYRPSTLPQIPIQITEVQVNGTPKAFTSGIQLKPGNNDLLFSYKGLCLRCAGRVTYRYRLLGADSNWTETTSQMVQFANLAPGAYTFELQASSYSGNTNTSKKSIDFSIRPRIWEIVWVQWATLLISICIISLLIRRRFKTVQRQNRFELEIDQLKFQALNAQMNPHFVFNAMNAIQQFVLKNDVLMSNKYLGKFARLTRLVLDNSSEQLVDLQSDMDALKLYIEIEALRFPGLFDWSIEVDPRMNPMTIKVPPLLLQPLVENSIKHGLVPKKGGGELVISIQMDDEHLLCSVQDNGIGRQASSWAKNKRKNHKPVGLENTKKRIELLESMHGKKVVYEIIDMIDADKQAIGTCTNLKLPLLTSSFPTA